jgi:hypothetical protein
MRHIGKSRRDLFEEVERKALQKPDPARFIRSNSTRIVADFLTFRRSDRQQTDSMKKAGPHNRTSLS